MMLGWGAQRQVRTGKTPLKLVRASGCFPRQTPSTTPPHSETTCRCCRRCCPGREARSRNDDDDGFPVRASAVLKSQGPENGPPRRERPAPLRRVKKRALSGAYRPGKSLEIRWLGGVVAWRRVAPQVHGTARDLGYFHISAGHGYVTTQDGTSRSESRGLRRLEIERSAHGHCSAPSHPCRALG